MLLCAMVKSALIQELFNNSFFEEALKYCN